MDIQTFKMRPGTHIEDVDLDALLSEHFDDDNPVLADVYAGIDETPGEAKNHLAFGIETIDPQVAIDRELFDEMKAVIEAKNEFLEAVTGRDASLRKDDMTSK